MPLSKVRDRDRKRIERARLRLDKQFNDEPVQPQTIRREGKDYLVPELDADGNLIPDYE